MTEELIVTQASEPKKMKKEKSKARKIIEWILFGLFGVLFAFVLAGNISSMIHKDENYGQSIRFGFGSFIVVTTSMEPEIAKDSAIITYRENANDIRERFNNGETVDVTFVNIQVDVSFEPETPEFKFINGGQQIVTNLVMTHRLREIHEDPSVEYGQGRFIFVTSGINDGGDYSLKGQYQIFTEKQYLGTVKIANSALGGFLSFVSSPIGLIVLLLVPAAYLIVTSSIDILRAMKESETAEATTVQTSDRLAGLSDEQREKLKKQLLDEMIEAKRKEKNNDQSN